ncbi:hypothetical protein [Skermania sp. ID1734]|uniref:hypothetical protein n=1 Tax=Skermania sp. ID1734 TaxID=2597516 RepID=UPI00117FEEBC|nr:hypothetical protein [Skermania sp. ID1734]
MSTIEGAPGLTWARKRYGGLWVGGRVTLTSRELTFTPNAANKLLHQGDPSFAVSLADIRRVDVEPAFFTDIIAIEWTGGLQRIRCYGATRFADKIRAGVAGLPF